MTVPLPSRASHDERTPPEGEPLEESAQGDAGASPRYRDTGKRLKRRVVVVDGDGESRAMYAWCLRAAGWVVEEASSGEEALYVVSIFLPDALFVDLALPGMDGFEVTRRLKSDETTRSILIVTCSDGEPQKRRVDEILARGAGCDAYVSKPVSPDHLRVLLESAFAQER